MTQTALLTVACFSVCCHTLEVNIFFCEDEERLARTIPEATLKTYSKPAMRCIGSTPSSSCAISRSSGKIHVPSNPSSQSPPRASQNSPTRQLDE